jgi:hypothetical protein
MGGEGGYYLLQELVVEVVSGPSWHLLGLDMLSKLIRAVTINGPLTQNERKKAPS